MPNLPQVATCLRPFVSRVEAGRSVTKECCNSTAMQAPGHCISLRMFHPFQVAGGFYVNHQGTADLQGLVSLATSKTYTRMDIVKDI